MSLRSNFWSALVGEPTDAVATGSQHVCFDLFDCGARGRMSAADLARQLSLVCARLGINVLGQAVTPTGPTGVVIFGQHGIAAALQVIAPADMRVDVWAPAGAPVVNALTLLAAVVEAGATREHRATRGR